MNNLNKFEIGTLIAVLSGAVWVGALTTKVEFLHEDYGAVKKEREKTINEIQSQKEIVLAEIQQAINPASINELRDNLVEIEQRLKRVQQAMNGTQIKAFESQLVKFETRITQVQQTFGTLPVAELQTQVAGIDGKLNQLNQTLSALKAKTAQTSQQALTNIESQTKQTLAKIQATKQQAISEFQPNLSEAKRQIKTLQQDIRALNVNGLKTNFAQLQNELNILNKKVEALKEKIATIPHKEEPKQLAKLDKPSKSQSVDKGVFRHRLKIGGNGPKMVTIPAWRFKMGSNSYDREKPIHWVSIKTFAMSRYEITFDEYDAFATATGKTKPSDSGWGRGNRPVVNVSWHDAVAYTKWLSEQTGQQYRLPTEAEWEYAARAGTETNYWWGNEIGKNRANCNGCGSKWDGKQTAPVGSFEANQFGLYDTVGNVWEWCADNWHKNYDGAPTDGSAWKGGNESRRVLRGGSWSINPVYCRTALRGRSTSDYRYQNIVFRVAVAAR